MSSYTNNKLAEKEILFTLAIKKNQIPRNKFNQGSKFHLQGKFQNIDQGKEKEHRN